MDDGILYDEHGAGRYLGGTDKPISPRTLQRHRAIGDGPKFVRIGRLVRYSRASLDEYLAKNTRSSTSDPGPRLD